MLKCILVIFIMGAWLFNHGFKRMVAWMKKQADDEIFHAMKIFDYVLEKEDKVEFFDIEQPKQERADVTDVFEDALLHEKKVIKMIHNLIKLAKKIKMMQLKIC